jgi:hypothetical protein
MPSKLKIWNPNTSWESAEQQWEAGSKALRQSHPLKTLPSLPQIPGITEETAKGLKWKSLKYIFTHDTTRALRYVYKHPLQYTWRWIKSALKKRAYHREGDFFFYGIKNFEEFQTLSQCEDAVLVIGFSYCHKPFECPSGRFSESCIHDPQNPVCRQCFIGKTVNALPEKASIVPLFIPTIHYIGEKMLELRDKYPNRPLVFLITACELTLEMFGDFGNMVAARGIGVRLDGRICNTMKAFELSEKGIKPGLTVVLPETQVQILALVKSLWSHSDERGEKA